MPPFTPLFIDGKQVPSSTNDTFEVRNPSSGMVVGTSAAASSQDCRAAVEAAGKAFETWEHTSPIERRDIFLRAADIVATEKYKKKITETIQEETASAPFWAYTNWANACNFLRVHAGLVSELRGSCFPSAIVPGAKVETHRRAIGVILGIAPWNAPFTLSIRSVAVPIICGNTVILKSSEYSPRSQAIVAELFQEAGLPKGVLNFLSMSKESAPALTAEIIAHPLVRKINFTGSDRVGRILAVEAAKHLKPCVLELGGKSPLIVLDDANVSGAIKAITFGSMIHSGQVCMSTERVIVQRGISEALIAGVRDLCKTLKAGDPMVDPSAKLAALFTEASAENVLALIRDARDAGAEVLLGDLSRRGSVVQPHLVGGIRPGMKLWDQESFGPVAAFAIVDTIDEAVDMANASEYTLAASIWTSNMYSAQYVISRVRAGYTNINGSTIHSEPLVSHLGLGGASGYGRFDIENFTETRVVVTHQPGRQYPLFD